MKDILLPPPLKKGDFLGIFAPAGNIIDKKRFEAGVKVIRGMGFKPVFPSNLWPGCDYLSDTDANRSHEFYSILANNEIKGIIALRGGYGCLRLLDNLDFSILRKTPKLIVGFSDITILANTIFNETGLVSLHGPVLNTLGTASRPTRERFFQSLTGKWDHPLTVSNIEILKIGREESGSLLGGNLASLVSMLGTKYDRSWQGRVIFLEDINEPLYRIDRMLTQLALAGKFKELSALVLGSFSGVYTEDSVQQLRYTEAIWQRVLALTQNEDYPIWANFPIGHGTDNFTVPIGAITTLDSNKTCITFSAP